MSKFSMIRKSKKRIFLWVDNHNYCIDNGETNACKTACDAIISFALTNGITDLLLNIRDTWISPANAHQNLTGEAKLANGTDYCWCTPRTVVDTDDGNKVYTPYDYMLTKAHQNGMKAHVWYPVHRFSHYYKGNDGNYTTVSCLKEPLQDLSYRNGTGDIIDFSIAAMRNIVTTVLTCFIRSNPLTDGINLDTIRSDGNATQLASDVSLMVHEIRLALPNLELSACVLGSILNSANSPSSNGGYAQDGIGWCAAGDLDFPILMAYNENMAVREEYMAAVLATGHKAVAGLCCEDGTMALSSWKARLLQLTNRGNHKYMNRMSYFQYLDFLTDSNKAQALRDARNGTLSVTQPAITKISLTPGSSYSVTMTLNGSEKTFAYDTTGIAALTTEGPLKTYIESASLWNLELPFVFFRRPSTTTISINIGDWR